MTPGKLGELSKYLALWRLGGESARFCVCTKSMKKGYEKVKPDFFNVK